MTERQKKAVAKMYFDAYLEFADSLHEIKKTSDRIGSIHRVEINLRNQAERAAIASAVLDAQHSILRELRLGVKVLNPKTSSFADDFEVVYSGDPVLVDFTELSDDERGELYAEFLFNKIIVEGGELS